MAYFETLKQNYRNDYLTKQPHKQAVIKNALVDGIVTILPNSNNRAIIIRNSDGVYLQSYDTLILHVDNKGKVHKLWNEYSKTTLNHINDFLRPMGYSFNKKQWLDF